MPQTLYEKIWNEHIVHQQDDGTTLLYVDRHLIHEVTSPQAFEGLRLSKRKVRKPNLTLAVADHNVPTTNRSKGITDEESRIQVNELEYAIHVSPGYLKKLEQLYLKINYDKNSELNIVGIQDFNIKSIQKILKVNVK